MINIKIFLGMGIVFFKRLYSWIDIFTLVINFYILYEYLTSNYVIITEVNEKGVYFEEQETYRHKAETLRLTLLIGQLVLFQKA